MIYDYIAELEFHNEMNFGFQGSYQFTVSLILVVVGSNHTSLIFISVYINFNQFYFCKSVLDLLIHHQNQTLATLLLS